VAGGRLDKAFIDYIGTRAIRGSDGVPGPTGPTGPAGAPGPTETSISYFVYNSASPLIIQALTVGTILNRVSICIYETVNTISSLQLGTFANPGLFFDSTDVNLNQLGSFDNQQIYMIDIPDFLVLTLAAPGATQGKGSIIVKTG